MLCRAAASTMALALCVSLIAAAPSDLAGVIAARDPVRLNDTAFVARAATLQPIGAHTQLLPEASDAGSNAALKVDGQSGDVSFPHGNIKPIVTVGEYDKTSGYMPVGVPDGMGVMLKNANEVRVIFQAESYGYISQGVSYPMTVNDGATSFTGSHIAYIDYNRNAMSTFMSHANSAESMVNGAGELIETVFNLAGKKVGARDATDKTTVHYGDTNAAGEYVSADADVNTGNLWTYHSFCSAHLEEREQWGTGVGLVADTFLTVEEWTLVNSTIVQEKGYVGLSAHAVDITTKTAYAVGAFGMGGYEKIVEVNCGVTGYVCFSLSGYNGNFGANSQLLARKKATGTGKRADGTDWAYTQDVVPARLYIGAKGYTATGVACGDTCTWLQKNGLEHGRVYGFAAPTATADRDAWHKGNFRDGSGDTVTGVFAPTAWKWDGVVKDFTTDQAWEFQEPPIVSGANSATHKFWTAAGRDTKGSKTEHNSPDPRGGNRFVQSSTAGYIGVYDFTGITTTLTALAAGDLPASFAATYEIVEGESDISDRIVLQGKGVRADSKLQTHMFDGKDKNTFEDVDGLEWIAAAGGKDYLVIQEDGGNRYGERIFLAEIPPSGVKPTYMFIAMAGGALNNRILSKVSIPAGTWSRATASEFSGVADLSGILKSTTGLGGKARRDADAAVAIEDKYIALGLQQHSQAGGVIADFRVDRGGQVLIWKPANVLVAPYDLAGVKAARDPVRLNDTAFPMKAATLQPIGAHTQLLPEASDAGSNAALKVDGQSGDVSFPHGNIKPIVTVGEYDKTSGYMPVGVPDGMGVMLKNANEVRVIFQAESYGYISQGVSYPMTVNDGATSFTGSHIAYIDYNRNAMSTFMSHANSAESMVNGAGELIETVFNLAGKKVGARDATDKTTVHYGDTNAAGEYVSADADVNTGNLWTYHSFCSAHLEEREQWGTGVGLVADTFLTVEEWTLVNSTIVQEKGYVGLSAHAVDITTKTAYAVGAFGMGGYEKIVEVNCGVTGYVCFSLSGYNGNFGANSQLLARKKATGTGKRADGTDWAYTQDVVPARLYIGAKGYTATGVACGDTCTWLQKNGLEHGRVYGFAAPTATADRDAWHKGNFRDGSGDTVTGVFAPTAWKWDGVVKDFTTDQAWEFQEPPIVSGANSATHKFWTAAGRDTKGSKTEHNSPDPRGGNRFVQSSTAGYIGVYDFTGITTTLTALAAGDLPASFAATYEIVEGESDISDRIVLQGKGVRADSKLQTHMFDGKDKNTFEDVDGLEWIAAAGGKDYLVIQEDGGNRYGERIFLAEIPPSGVKPTYMFIAMAGGALNNRILSKVSIPAGTWSRATASEFSGVADLSGILKSTTGLGGKARRDADAAVAIEDKYIALGLQQHSQAGGVIADFRVDRGGQVLIWKPANVLVAPYDLAGVKAARDPVRLNDTAFPMKAATLQPIGAHTQLLPEASDAGSNAALKVDGQSGDVSFPHGNIKPIVTVGEYDKTSGYMPVGVPDGMGVMLKNANEVRVIFQAESYGYISQGVSYPMTVNDGATSFTGSHIAYIDYNRNAMSTFMSHANSAESMVNGAGELIETVFNLAGKKVGARDATDKTTVHYGDTNAAGEYVSADADVNTGNLWTYHSFCSAHLEEREQWGTGVGLVADTFLTVEEWTLVNSTIVQEKGYVGLSAHAVDITTKTAYAVGAFGMGGYEKIVEVNCGVTGYVCFSLSGYNGNFGANSQLLARKKATGTGKRADGTDWAYTQDVVPARLYIGAKGYTATGVACGDTCTWLQKNGLEHGRVYGFAAPTATADRDAWHKGNFRDGSGDTVTGVFAPTAWKWDGVVKDFTTDQAWEFQEPPIVSGANSATHKFWTAAGRDTKGSKTEHNSPDPRGGNRFVQSSTAGYIGVYDFTGITTTLTALAAGDLPASFAATYEIVEGESDISDRIVLQGKGVRADSKLQTHMFDGKDKNTFEDVDGLEWIAAAGGKDYLVIQEDGGNRYGERIFLAEIPPSGVKPTYMFIAMAGGALNNRILSKVSIPAGTWSRATASEFSGVADLSGILKSTTGLGGKARRDADAAVAIEDKYIALGLQQHSQAGGVIADFRVDRGGQVLIWKPANVLPQALAAGEATAEVFAAVKLTGYTVETFKEAQQLAFKKGVSTLVGVNAADVKINKITASVARRQLLAAAIEIDYSIKLKDAAAATAATKSLNDVTPATMVAVFKSSGLTTIESIVVTKTPSNVASPSPGGALPPPVVYSPPPTVVESGADSTSSLVFTTLALLFVMMASLA